MATVSAEARLRRKNQLTLPDDIARAIGTEPGDQLIFEWSEDCPGEVRVRRLLASYAGILAGVYGQTSEEVEAYIRAERASWGE